MTTFVFATCHTFDWRPMKTKKYKAQLYRQHQRELSAFLWRNLFPDPTPSLGIITDGGVVVWNGAADMLLNPISGAEQAYVNDMEPFLDVMLE